MTEIIQTGQNFVARDKLGREYVYRLRGIDPGPESAGRRIRDGVVCKDELSSSIAQKPPKKQAV